LVRHRRGVLAAPPASVARFRLGRGLFIGLSLSFATVSSSLVGSPGPVAADVQDQEAIVGAGWWTPPLDEALSPDEPETQTVRLEPPPRRGAFSMNLFTRGDFAHQQTEYWCVAAAAQTMMNIIDEGKPNTSKAFQRRLHFQARRLDQDDDGFWRRLTGETRWRRGLHGLGISDWADLLNTNGYGPYELDRARTRKQAIRMAARAIRMTGRPAGLVVWRGAHSWVMSGFKATADPAWTDDFEIRKVFIQDPWYPFVSTIWGASRPPNSAVPVAVLAEDYLRYNRPLRRHPMRDGKYMLILPTLPPETQVQ